MKSEEEKAERHQREVSVVLSSLARPSAAMSCDILPDGPHVPSSSSSTQHSLPAHLAAHVTLASQHKDPEGIKTEVFGDAWDGDRNFQYQCDISCYGVTAAGDGVTDPGAMMKDEEEEGGVRGEGERETWWAAQNKSASYFNAVGDKCPSQTHEDQVEGYDAHENEERRGGDGDGGGGDEKEAAFSLWPLPPLSHDGTGREEGFFDGVTVSRRAFCDVRNQECGLSDVTSHEPSVDTFTSPEHNAPGDVNNYRLLSRHSGIQLPVMTIEIEKWLMGLIVNDEEDEKRKKRGKNAKKKSKQGAFIRHGSLKVGRNGSGTKDAPSDSIHSQVRFMFTCLALTSLSSTKTSS